jgi:DNA-binding HxlR family transcriptional regulator
MTNKITKKEMFKRIQDTIATVEMDVAEKELYIEFLASQIKLLEKRSSATRKPTQKQLENEEYKATIKTYIDSTPRTVTEIMQLEDSLSALSNQKVTQLLRQLVEEGSVTRVVDERKSYYKIAD